MNRKLHAARVGLARGWTEFKQSLQSPQDQGFYFFMALVTLGYLFLRRGSEVEGTALLYPAVAMPSILGALITFGLIAGPTYQIAMDREDGTLLRAKAVPHGILGYVCGQVFGMSLGLVPTIAVIVLPGLVLFEDVMARGPVGLLTMAWVVGLGLMAMLQIGIIIGSLVPGVQRAGTWGMLPILVLSGISGIFYPMQQLWGWLQVVAQIFPMYWLGLGMRAAFLPDAAAVIEIGGSWRTLETLLVLGAWAALGLVLAPKVLRRMARGMSGSQVEAARLQAAQWVR